MKTLLLLAMLVATPASAHDLTWDWTQTQGGGVPTGFNVFRKKATEAAYSLLAATDANARSFSDPDRTVGNCYALTAFNAFGASASVTACAMGPDGSISIVVLK